MIYKNNNADIVDFKGYDAAKDLLRDAYKLRETLKEKMSKFAFDQAIFEILTHSSKCNEFINIKAPWNLKKEGKVEEMNFVLSVIAENLRVIAITLQAFIPNLAGKILDVLNIDQAVRSLDVIDENAALKNGHKINEPKVIFPRLEIK